MNLRNCSPVIVGIFIGYDRWGATASIVRIVEKELAVSHEQIAVLEKKVAALEAKLGTGSERDSSGAPDSSASGAVGDGLYKRTKAETRAAASGAEAY